MWTSMEMDEWTLKVEGSGNRCETEVHPAFPPCLSSVLPVSYKCIHRSTPIPRPTPASIYLATFHTSHLLVPSSVQMPVQFFIISKVIHTTVGPRIYPSVHSALYPSSHPSQYLCPRPHPCQPAPPSTHTSVRLLLRPPTPPSVCPLPHLPAHSPICPPTPTSARPLLRPPAPRSARTSVLCSYSHTPPSSFLYFYRYFH